MMLRLRYRLSLSGLRRDTLSRLSFHITLSALCLLQTTLCSIVRQAEGALMESESINMEGSVEVTLAPN